MNCIRYKLVPIEAILLVLLLSCNASGISLRGYFPKYQGRFWNFSQTKSNHISTWAINGTLTLRGVGSVFMMVQDNSKFLCMRDDWKGLYIYGEYEKDKYFIPEEPLLFLPSKLNPNKLVKTSVDLRVFSDPEGGLNFKETGKVNREITFRLKGIEDIKVGSKEFKYCIVVEKNTKEQDKIFSEILWLAPSVGPIKRVVQRGNEKITYTILSYAGPGTKQDKCFSVKELYPLRAGITWTYQGLDGQSWVIKTRENERINGITTTPFAEDTGDIYYYAIDRNGLVLPQKFWSSVGGCTVFHPPELPVVVLPATLELGSFCSSTSTPRVHAWPSMTPVDEFFTETQYSSIALCLEDVNVPSGMYRECLKICLFTISRNFSVKNEKIRVGYIWLAQDNGIIKEELIGMTNYFHPLRKNKITAVRFWKLTNLKKQTVY